MPTRNLQPPTDLSKKLLGALDDLNNGIHAGFRPAHAKGAMLSGTFVPSAEAAWLTRAPHAKRSSTPVTARFSNATGIPTIHDNDPKISSPRGFALRFHLGDHEHTDIIGHSTNAFPSRTAEEFLEFLQAAYRSGPNAPKPTPIEQYLGTHPKALHFVMAAKPIPTSFARESFFTLNAFKFIGTDGTARFGRFQIRPELGTEYLDDIAAAAKPAEFLFTELKERINREPIKLRVVVQLAEEGDVVDDATTLWPDTRRLMEFGVVTLEKLIEIDDSESKRIIFDPIPRVDGIESSGDPLLEPRADLYLLSGRRRRAANE